MEYCAGGRLTDWLRLHGPLEGGNVAQSLMQQLFSAVSFLHCELNIVHRDLKPEVRAYMVYMWC